MEYLPGMSLSELVRASGPLPPGRAVYLMRQVCGSLAEAHRLGLMHRDIIEMYPGTDAAAEAERRLKQ